MTLGERLQEARKRTGLSQIAAARHTGVSKVSISNYERNYREPGLATLAELAKLYEVSLDYLIYGHAPIDCQASLTEVLEEFRSQLEGRRLTASEREQIANVVASVLLSQMALSTV